MCSYYDIGDAHRAAWSYREAYTEVARVSDLVSFEPDKVTVHLDDRQLHLDAGQTVIPHGVDRDLTVHEVGRSTPSAQRLRGLPLDRKSSAPG